MKSDFFPVFEWEFTDEQGMEMRMIYMVMQGCQTHFHWGPHQPCSCLQRAEIILGPYKCNYSLIVKGLKLHLDFQGNREADEAPGENEFDTPALN